MEIVYYDFQINGDERGSLISLEEQRNIPFDIKRVYYIFDVKKDLRRGFHAHKELKQVLIAINGTCKVMLDDGTTVENINLDSRSRGLLVDKLIWHEMYDFSDDLVLLVLASDYYDENDYLRNYDSFIEYMGRSTNE